MIAVLPWVLAIQYNATRQCAQFGEECQEWKDMCVDNALPQMKPTLSRDYNYAFTAKHMCCDNEHAGSTVYAGAYIDDYPSVSRVSQQMLPVWVKNEETASLIYDLGEGYGDPMSMDECRLGMLPTMVCGWREHWFGITGSQKQDKAKHYDGPYVEVTTSDLVYPNWGDKAVDPQAYAQTSKVTRRLRRLRTRYSAQWSNLIEFDPETLGDCLFDCASHGCHLDLGGQSAREWCCSQWCLKGNRQALAEAAACEGESPGRYLKALENGRWGGVPEARIVALAAGVCICAWDQQGQLLY